MPRIPSYTTDEPADMRAAWFEDHKGVAKTRPDLSKIEVSTVEGSAGLQNFRIWYWTGAELRQVSIQVKKGDDWMTEAARKLEADLQRVIGSLPF